VSVPAVTRFRLATSHAGVLPDEGLEPPPACGVVLFEQADSTRATAKAASNDFRNADPPLTRAGD
jgi:hypothetical protein